VSEPGWEQAGPTFPYLDESPPAAVAQAGLASAVISVTPEPYPDDSED
jgi:hypothetical protein